MLKKFPDIFRITGTLLVYAITFTGLIALPFIFVLPEFWWLGFFFVIALLPIFPAAQLLLLGQRPVNPLTFVKIYVAEYVSLAMQLLFLLVIAPFIAAVVAGVLPIMMLVASVIMWPIVGLQQLGFKIGSKMPAQDIEILFWVTGGSFLLTGVYFGLYKLIQRYGERYFDLWGMGFRKVRDFYHY